jgi:chromosome segregation ATPase
MRAGQALLENAWHTTSTNVQYEMLKMHQHYANIYREREENSASVITRLRADRNASRSEAQKVKLECTLLGQDKASLTRENESLRKQLAERNEELQRSLAENAKMMDDSSRLSDERNLAQTVRVRIQWQNRQLAEELERVKATGASNANANSASSQDSHSLDVLREEFSKQLEAQMAGGT